MSLSILIITDTAQHAIGNSFHRALSDIGHQTEMFDLRQSVTQHVKGGKIGHVIHTFWPVEAWIKKGNRALAVYLQRLRPDIIIVSGNVPLVYGALALAKSVLPDVKTVFFWPDPLINLETSLSACVPFYDVVATYSKATIPIFRQMGFKQAVWFPFAGDIAFLGGHDNEYNRTGHYEYDISFIGGWRPEREKALTVIQQHFPALKMAVLGQSWTSQCKNPKLKPYIKPTELVGAGYGDFLKKSRMNLNVMDDNNYPAANMRFFEVPAVGGLQISSHCPEQENIFQHRKHILYFKDENDLCDQIEFVNNNPESAARIRREASTLVKNDHTYLHRFKELLANL